MKKVLAVLLVGLAATSFGVVNVDWGSSYGYYFDLGAGDPGVGILGPDGSGKSTVAQLVYCGVNGVRDGVNIGGATLGDDAVWASYALSSSGDYQTDVDGLLSYAHFAGNLQNFQSAFTTGNVYARIFQDNVIGGGDWYFYTPTLALADITGTMFAQSIEMAADGMVAINNGTSGLNVSMDPTTGSALSGVAQVIPEPATLLLFGIGGFGAWLLRRRQQA